MFCDLKADVSMLVFYGMLCHCGTSEAVFMDSSQFVLIDLQLLEGGWKARRHGF